LNVQRNLVLFKGLVDNSATENIGQEFFVRRLARRRVRYVAEGSLACDFALERFSIMLHRIRRL